MTNVYYTTSEGRRNANGHTITRGDVYIIKGDALENIGDYRHYSGGADISLSILSVAEKAGVDTNGGYYKNWHEAVKLILL